ncbi:MAG: hypothetical protein NTU53_07150 [Planctomycetota bacterium]|nr:hypothetical protein [Planctomycetota bacterium]
MKIRGSLIVWMVIATAALSGPAWGQGKVDPFSKPESPKAAKDAGVISSVELVDSPVTNVFKMISDLTGWSIFMSPEISEKPPKVNIWIKNLTPDQVLERIGIIADLVVERKGSSVEVMTFDEYSRTRGLEKRIIQLKHAKSKDVATILQPFIQRDKDKTSVGRMMAGEESNKLVLLLPAPLLESLLRVVESLDVPFEKDTVKVVVLKHLEAANIVPRLEKFLADTANKSGRTGQGSSVAVPVAPAGTTPASAGSAAGERADMTRAGDRWLVQFMIEPKLNVIVLRGLAADVIQTEELIMRLDAPPLIDVVAYQLKYTNARDVYRTLQEIVMEDLRSGGYGGGSGMSGGVSSGSGSDRNTSRLKVSASEQNNQIIVEGSPTDQQRMAKIIAAIDKPLPPSSGGIRVYRLENSSAREVADVVQGVINSKDRNGRLAVQERHGGLGDSARAGGAMGAGAATGTASALPPAAARGGDAGGAGGAAAGSGYSGAADVIPAQVTAAAEINAVVIKASASEHEEFLSLIRELDRPRDQVMLEVTLVTVRSTNNFNLGVELSGAHLNTTNTIGFSNFGVGKVDSATGNLAFTQPPPFGLNFGVFRADEFNVVFNALKTVGDTRITATPKILVEDNATAEIKQLSKEPYTVLSQGATTTVTSFGGFAEAGATLAVVPHVSKEDWLRLEYQVNLSSFDKRSPQQLAANLPPPIRQNTSQGTVRIPAEYTVVLGGLASTRDETVRDGIPLLMDIPLVGSLFENRSSGQVKETLFIFIRPIVLRDLKFKDLQFLSLEDVQQAKLSRKDFPDNPLKSFAPAVNGTGKEQMQ